MLLTSTVLRLSRSEGAGGGISCPFLGVLGVLVLTFAESQWPRGAAGSPFAELHPRVYITPSATANLFACFPHLQLHPPTPPFARIHPCIRLINVLLTKYYIQTCLFSRAVRVYHELSAKF